jgi:hypothetical protein
MEQRPPNAQSMGHAAEARILASHQYDFRKFLNKNFKAVEPNAVIHLLATLLLTDISALEKNFKLRTGIWWKQIIRCSHYFIN